MDISDMDMKGPYKIVDILERDSFNRRRDELIGQVVMFYEDLHRRLGRDEQDYWGGTAVADNGGEQFYFYGVKIEPVDRNERPLW